MSKPKVLALQAEIDDIMAKFANNRFLMAEAFLQVIHRENIITGNRIRARHGEPEIIPEPVMYRQGGREKELTWIIDVPKNWISLVGKDGQS